MPDVIEDIEVLDLSALDFKPHVSCSFEDCQNEAKWMLVCGICSVGKETVCILHHAEFVTVAEAEPFMSIRFNETCGHSPLISMCWWEPIN